MFEEQKKIFNLKQDVGTQIIQKLLDAFPNTTFEEIHNDTLFMASEKYLNVLIDRLSRGFIDKPHCEYCNNQSKQHITTGNSE